MKRRIFLVMLAALAAGCSNGGAGGDSSVGVSNAEHLGETSFSSPEKFVERWNQQTNDPLVAIKNGHNIDSHFNASGPNQPIGLLHSDQINLNVGDEDLTHVYVIYIKSQKKYSYVALTKGEGNLDGSVICRNMIVAAGLSEQEANIIFGRASDMLESNKSLGSAKYKGISVSLAYTPTPICSVSEINSEMASAPNGGGEGIGPETTIDREKLKRDAVTYIAASHKMNPDDVVNYSADVSQISSIEYRLGGSFIVESDAPTNIYEAASAHVNSRICSLDPNQCASTKFKHTVNFDAIATVYKKLDGTEGIKWDAKVAVDKPLDTPAASSPNDGLTDSEKNEGWKRVLLTSDVTITDAFQQMGLGLADLQRVMDALGPDVSKFNQVSSSPVDFMMKDQTLDRFRFEAPPGRITVLFNKDGASKTLERKVADGKFVSVVYRCISHGTVTYTTVGGPDCSMLAGLGGVGGGPAQKKVSHLTASSSIRAEPVRSNKDLQWVSHINPPYPPQAMRQGHEGTVNLIVLVGATGLPKDIKVETSSGYRELDRAAIEAAQKWRFSPAIKNGQATESYMRTPVNFSLNRATGPSSSL